MRRGTMFTLLILFLTLLTMALPQRVHLVLAYRVLLWANQDLSGQSVQELSSSLVQVRMSEGDDAERELIRTLSEQALRVLHFEFGYQFTRPVRVVVNTALGSDMGRYYLGQVDVRPRAEWQSPQGPLLHELTHYVVDVITGGNYPAWLSEGLALYMELKHEDHRWSGNGRHVGTVPYESIDKYLGDPEYYVDAYAQALGMVEYIYELRGSEGISMLLAALGRGQRFERAFLQVFEVTTEGFVQGWQEWDVYRRKRIVAQR